MCIQWTYVIYYLVINVANLFNNSADKVMNSRGSGQCSNAIANCMLKLKSYVKAPEVKQTVNRGCTVHFIPT